jgi:hypothetical protein
MGVKIGRGASPGRGSRVKVSSAPRWSGGAGRSWRAGSSEVVPTGGAGGFGRTSTARTPGLDGGAIAWWCVRRADEPVAALRSLGLLDVWWLLTPALRKAPLGTAQRRRRRPGWDAAHHTLFWGVWRLAVWLCRWWIRRHSCRRVPRPVVRGLRLMSVMDGRPLRTVSRPSWAVHVACVL